MVTPSRDVVLSPEARVDFTDIDIHTLERWGDEQRDRYLGRLEHAIAGLASTPEVGARRDRVFAGCRVLSIEQHVVYYRLTSNAIEVVRVLHKRADPARHIRL